VSDPAAPHHNPKRRWFIAEIWDDIREECKIALRVPYFSFVIITGFLLIYGLVRFGGAVVNFPSEWLEPVEKMDFYFIVAMVFISGSGGVVSVMAFTIRKFKG
jgi:hypothetical protein